MKVILSIPKMKCDGCVKTIAEALLLVDGLNQVEIRLEQKQVEFEVQNQTDLDQAKRALVKAGFPPQEEP